MNGRNKEPSESSTPKGMTYKVGTSNVEEPRRNEVEICKSGESGKKRKKERKYPRRMERIEK